MVTLAHIGPLGALGSEALWYVGQFGPLLVASAASVLMARRWILGSVGFLLIALAVLAGLSALWSSFPWRSLSQSLVLCLAIVFLISTWSVRWTDRRTLFGDLTFIYSFGVAAAAAGAVLWLAHAPATMGNFDRFQGVYTNPNYAAIAAALSISIGVWLLHRPIRRSLKLGVAATLVGLMVTIWVSGSRGALVAAVAGALVTLSFSAYRRFVFLVIAAASVALVAVVAVMPGTFFGAGGFFDRSDQGSDFTSGRLAIWERLVSLWTTRPMLGIGYKTVEALPGSADLNAHNVYLSVLVELGVVGIVVLVALVTRIIVVGLRSRASTDRMLLGGVVTVLLIELTEASLFGFGGPTATLSWLVLLAFGAAARCGSTDGDVGAVAGSRASDVLPLADSQIDTAQVTVCIATYNGENYVAEQITSILSQLGPNDEVVVVDDASTDGTLAVLDAIGDSRVKVTAAETNAGHVATFERALSLAAGEVILLSDQDDVWLPGRVGLMRQALVDHAYVASNWKPLDGGPPSPDVPRLRSSDTSSPWRNIVRLYRGNIPYFGCAMGFRRDALATILPFPRGTDAHDHWVAIMGNLDGGIAHLDQYTVDRRLHDHNLTSGRRSIGPVVTSRLKMTLLLASAVVRLDRFGSRKLGKSSPSKSA